MFALNTLYLTFALAFQSIFTIFDAIIIYLFSINEDLIDYNKYLDYDFSNIKLVYCDFEENPIALPKQIQQQIRQGNSIISTVVVNPERIRETCEKNCKCFSKEFGCLRQNCQTCGEWTFRFSKRGKENA